MNYASGLFLLIPNRPGVGAVVREGSCPHPNPRSSTQCHQTKFFM